ncbi:MAG: 16S rRNA (adenine(1518)-N(6)/adenine(1519)-N(6))-dimethyltransferase RsmA [Bacillota bacterium]|nr:16S rRNA (adenine(1518)-N(6)/adenine(1519)-N(6))-dimethyltransferase RsmA [Bacillota bacterium]
MNRLPGTSPRALKALLAELGVRPDRRLGQNFLVDARVLRSAVEAAELHAGDAVLEVGPGTGTLSAALLEAGCRLLAVERDRRLAGWLSQALAGQPAFHLLVGDVLRLDWRSAWRATFGPVERALVVSNLPYAISGPLVRDLVTADEPAWERLVLLVQREFADRLTAPPGTEAYGALTLLTRRYARVERLLRVSPASFWPEPEVESALIRLWPIRPRPPREPFESLVRVAFAHRRKTLENGLKGWRGPRGGLGRPEVERLCRRAGLDPAVRAEELDVADFERLARVVEAGEL